MQLRFKVAGISDMGLVRTNNEDNFQIARDLSVEPMRWINNEACLLTPNGTLLVVADGMGGMNAGEVASQIAIDTIKEVFSPATLAGVNLGSVTEVNAHIAAAVAEADRRIKATAATRPETHGMGTTIVIAWLLGNKLHVGWCGDSRAYLYNTSTGLRRLSKDHSYVQTLVDSGKLTDEEAFDYPQSNIITRCLSDSNATAEADVLPVPVPVADGDIVLLCTDGLCGMLRDQQTEAILNQAPSADLTATAKSLIDGALAAGGADNVTVALLQIVSGAAKPSQRVLPPAFGACANPADTNPNPTTIKERILNNGFLKNGIFKKGILKNWIFILLAGIIAGIVIAILLFTLRGGKEEKKTTVQIDLISGKADSPEETEPQNHHGEKPVQTTPAEQLNNSLASGLAAIASTLPNGSTEAGPAAVATGSDTTGTPVQGDNATVTKKDSVAPAGATVPPPAERKTIKIKIGAKTLKQIVRDHQMKETELRLLNPEIDFTKPLSSDTEINVYEIPEK